MFCRKLSIGVKKSAKEGNPTEVTRAENDCRYYCTLGTLWPEIRATTCFLHAASRTLLEITFKMKHSRRINSSVGIDVIEPSRVARSEHLLEFLFRMPCAARILVCGN